MNSELKTLYEHVDDIEIAMLTTRRRDGHLRSRAMAAQKRAEGADLWFVTYEGSAKLDDLQFDPHVNLTYSPERCRRSANCTKCGSRKAGDTSTGTAASARAG
jgi:general stress protein 26